jgi:hypothetical protein
VTIGVFQGPVNEFRVGQSIVITFAVIIEAGSGRVAVSNGVRDSWFHAVNGNR